MSSVDSNVSTDARPHFLQALRRVLRPIIRLMIRTGIRYDEFADIARRAYVESAIRDTDSQAPRPTRDEVAWITGIKRKRVDHYIESNEASPGADQSALGILSEVLHRWHTDPRYQNPSGAPLEIEIDASSGPSLHSLVAQVDEKVAPQFVLDMLLRSGAVTYSDTQKIRAVTRCFVWPKGSIPLVEYLGDTLAHLIETHEHNFSSADAQNKRLERSVFAERGLSEQLLPSFHSFARDRADQLLSDLDNWVGELADPIKEQTEPRVEAGLNVFFYIEPPADTRELTALVKNRRRSKLTGEPVNS